MSSNNTKTLKASSALLKHIQSKAQSKAAIASTRDLLADPSDSSSDTPPNSDPVWLIFTTKKHIVDQARLKPGKISLPHSLYSASTIRICLLTADPQRAFKDTVAHPSFPTDLAPRITRIIGISKLKARYKSFESRRQLLAEYDIFLADSRIVTMLPNILGKTFYKGPKRPMPVNLEPSRPKDRITGKRRPRAMTSASEELSRAVASPKLFAQEVERALSSTQIHLSPSPTTAIRVGLASFTPEQVAANVEAVVNGMVARFVSKGWSNVRSVHIKGPNTLALPVWLAETLWVEETDVLEEAEAKRRADAGRKPRKKKPTEIEPSAANEVAQSGEVGEGVVRKKRKRSRGKKLGRREEKEVEQREEGDLEERAVKKRRKRGGETVITTVVEAS